MGIIITKFRKKKTTEELLEKLEHDIKSIETYSKDTELNQKKIVGVFLLISIVTYLGVAFLLYSYYFPASIYEKLWYIVPLMLAPLGIVVLKKVLTFFFTRRISKNQSKLRKLNDEKKQILERVMETETYKVAKIILEKYAPEQLRKTNHVPSMITGTPINPKNFKPPLMTPTVGLRQRPIGTPTPSKAAFGPASPPQTPGGGWGPGAAAVATRASLPVALVQQQQQPSPSQLARSILPRDRSVFDRVVEYMVGDGPSNRYALICKQCSSHNGMALKEEFEYLSFKCCYCSTYNAARKMRPSAPKLEPLPIASYSPRQDVAIGDSETSDSEKNSARNSDEEDEDEDNEDNKDELDKTVVVEKDELCQTEDQRTVGTDAGSEEESGWNTEAESVVADQ